MYLPHTPPSSASSPLVDAALQGSHSDPGCLLSSNPSSHPAPVSAAGCIAVGAQQSQQHHGPLLKRITDTLPTFKNNAPDSSTPLFRRDSLHDQSVTIGAVVGILVSAFVIACFYFLYRYRSSIRFTHKKKRRRHSSRSGSSKGSSQSQAASSSDGPPLPPGP
ncbi:hypothetical protein B0T17DRAFT_621498 [Bombardia bombarda]|uniref:Uncharacterized protein n=1 Tax=Bombardia bombarda TaxID=252184 RepID=A0AA39WBE4_9PEZI|nr:hypothetical protein B0T17DRAFT_621498 [Bombardia bombarda]